MPVALIPFFSGSITDGSPDTMSPGSQYWENHIGYTLVDDGVTIPLDAVIDQIHIRVCAGRFQTARALGVDIAPILVSPGTTPPDGLGWTSGSGSPYFDTSLGGVEGIVCKTSLYLYPVRSSANLFDNPTINPDTGVRYTRAELFAYEFGWQFGAANLSIFFSVTVEDTTVEEAYAEITYSSAADSPSPSPSPSPSGPGTELPPPDSTPCCGANPDVPLGPNPGEILNPPLQPWDRQCAGGGVVLSEADLFDAETWVL